MRRNSMRVVSLFCGIGGLDKGFVDAGFNIVWANDFDQYAVQTYNANFNTKASLSLPLQKVLIMNTAFVWLKQNGTL